jgi:transcriptional regulator with XRE-family HTH domain
MPVSRPERVLTPDRSAVHRFGYELRQWRKARGLSLAKLAKLMLVSEDLLQKVETGDRRPKRPLAEDADRVLGAKGALIRLYEDVEREERAARNTATDADKSLVGIRQGATGLTVPNDQEMLTVWVTTLTGEQLPVMIDRRAMLAGMAAMPVTGLLGGTAKPRVPAPLHEGALNDILHSSTNLWVALAAQDNVLGPQAVVGAALQQVAMLQDLSRGAKGRAREKVLGKQASYAELCSWLVDDIGDRNAGLYWIDRALDWAYEGNDSSLIGYILARKAQRAIEDGTTAAAVGLGRAAQREDGGHIRLRAGAAVFEAQGHAALGDELAFERAISRSRELLANLGAPSAGEMAAWCTSGYITMYEAAGRMHLHQPAKAAEVYAAGLADWPDDMRRDEGLYYGRLAEAHAAASHPEQAADAGRTALEIANQTGSARILAELAPLPEALNPWRDSESVRSLLTELHHGKAA